MCHNNSTQTLSKWKYLEEIVSRVVEIVKDSIDKENVKLLNILEKAFL